MFGSWVEQGRNHSGSGLGPAWRPKSRFTPHTHTHQTKPLPLKERSTPHHLLNFYCRRKRFPTPPPTIRYEIRLMRRNLTASFCVTFCSAGWYLVNSAACTQRVFSQPGIRWEKQAELFAAHLEWVGLWGGGCVFRGRSFRVKRSREVECRVMRVLPLPFASLRKFFTPEINVWQLNGPCFPICSCVGRTALFLHEPGSPAVRPFHHYSGKTSENMIGFRDLLHQHEARL